MTHSTHQILAGVKKGSISIFEAERFLKLNAVEVVGAIARLDSNRYLRRGVPEIIYAATKSLDQIKSILRSSIRRWASERTSGIPIIVSKLNEGTFNSLRLWLKRELARVPAPSKMKYYSEASILAILLGVERTESEAQEDRGRVALLGAGTSDIRALSEAEILLKLLGCETIRFNDVGVAGLHRLKGPLKKIQLFDPDVIIVAAGMEGALPSLISSLASVPVVGLPTSVGFGFGGKGEAALMSMLQACPLGICVVNIDGGVAAGIIALLIAQRCAKSRTENKNF